MPARRDRGGRKVVALGGGHGLHVMLSALVRLDVDITAVVTVADDGGSSGRLRREVPGIVPPGDLRMALTALAAPDRQRPAVGHDLPAPVPRRGGAGRAPGRQHRAGRAEPGARRSGRRAGRGRRDRWAPAAGCCRCPASRWTSSPQVQGLDEDPTAMRTIRGQVAVATTPGQVRTRRAGAGGRGRVPGGARRDRRGRPDHLRARLLVHQRAAAPAAAGHGGGDHRQPRASRLVVLNLAAQQGETEGFSPEQHLDVLSAHAPNLRVDSVLADRASVALPQRLASAAARLGARLDLHDVPSREPRGTTRQVVGGRWRPSPGAGGGTGGAAQRRPRRVRSTSRSMSDRECTGMAMTATVKDELSRVAVSKVSARKAEVSALLRFAGGLHIVAGRVIVEAELDTGAVARRLRKEIGELYGHVADVQVLAASGHPQGHPVRGAGGRRRRLAGPADRADRSARPARARAAAADRRRLGRRRRGGLAGRVPGARLADRAGPQRLARGDLPRARRRRSPWSARPAGWASGPRPARCAAPTGCWSGTATRSPRC